VTRMANLSDTGSLPPLWVCLYQAYLTEQP